MGYALGRGSLLKLDRVHPKLVMVVKRAIVITKQDFSVLEGVRTMARQRMLKAKGKSTTLRSYHLLQGTGYAHAVDLGPYPYGADLDGDGIHNGADWDCYYPIEDAMKQAAKELSVPLTWGGDWKTFKDGPHFQIPRGLQVT